MDKGIPVISAVSMEIPVTPPSINRLESKKPFKPIAADRIPIVINTKLSGKLFPFSFKYIAKTLFDVTIGVSIIDRQDNTSQTKKFHSCNYVKIYL